MRRPEKASQVKAEMPLKTSLLNDIKDFLISWVIRVLRSANRIIILRKEVSNYAIAMPVNPKPYC